MSTALRALLYRERRRLGLVAGLAYLAGFLFYLSVPVYLGAVHIAFVTGAIYAGVVGAISVLVCALLPSMRHMIEAVAIARLLLACLAAAAPHLGYLLLGNPLLMALLVVSGGAAVSRLIHGRRERHGHGMRAGHRRAAGYRGTQRQQRFVAWVDGTPRTA